MTHVVTTSLEGFKHLEHSSEECTLQLQTTNHLRIYKFVTNLRMNPSQIRRKRILFVERTYWEGRAPASRCLQAWRDPVVSIA